MEFSKYVTLILLCVQPLESEPNMRNHAINVSTARSNSAVTANTMLSQQKPKNTSLVKPAGKTYRPSSVSTTIRVPNSLLREVKQFIAAARAKEIAQRYQDNWLHSDE